MKLKVGDRVRSTRNFGVTGAIRGELVAIETLSGAIVKLDENCHWRRQGLGWPLEHHRASLGIRGMAWSVHIDHLELEQDLTPFDKSLRAYLQAELS